MPAAAVVGAAAGARAETNTTTTRGKNRRQRQREVTAFETVNGTSWKGILSHLAGSRAQIIMAQEHKLVTDAEIKAASQAAKRLGWG